MTPPLKGLLIGCGFFRATTFMLGPMLREQQSQQSVILTQIVPAHVAKILTLLHGTRTHP